MGASEARDLRKNRRGDERTETSLRSVTIDAEHGQQRGSVFASTTFSCSGEAQSSLRMGLGRAGVLPGKYSKGKEEQG